MVGSVCDTCYPANVTKKTLKLHAQNRTFNIFPLFFTMQQRENHMPQKNDYSHTQRSKIGLSQISNVYDVTILWLETIIECITKILKCFSFLCKFFEEIKFQGYQQIQDSPGKKIIILPEKTRPHMDPYCKGMSCSKLIVKAIHDKNKLYSKTLRCKS